MNLEKCNCLNANYKMGISGQTYYKLKISVRRQDEINFKNKIIGQPTNSTDTFVNMAVRQNTFQALIDDASERNIVQEERKLRHHERSHSKRTEI